MKIIKFFNKIFGFLSNIDFGIFNYFIIKIYSFIFNVNLDECEKNICDYDFLNDFFYRKLKTNCREINYNNNIIVSPVDGFITKIGNMKNEKLFFIKNKNYSLNDLFKNNDILCNLEYEKFLIFYLSPKDYHRIHMPYDGKLEYMFYISGNFYTVNPDSYFFNYDNLFENERVICLFKTKFGYIVKILIGSILIGGIETVWHGVVNKNINFNINSWNYKNDKFFFKKGEEIGKFNIGSSVMLCFSKSEKLNFSKNIYENIKIKFGKDILYINN